MTEIPQRVPQALSLDPDATALPAPPAEHNRLCRQLRLSAPPARIAPGRLGRKLGLALFMGLSGALAFSILTDGGKQTRARGDVPPRDRRGPALDGPAHRASGPQRPALHPRCRRVRRDRPAQYRLARDLRCRAGARRASRSCRGSRPPPSAASSPARSTCASPSASRRRCGATTAASISSTAPAACFPRSRRAPTSGCRACPGEGAPEQAQALLELIVRFPRIAERFEMAERVGGRRWTLHLKDGVVVHLGRRSRGRSPLPRCRRPTSSASSSTSRDVIIDLRTRGRVTVRVAPQQRATATATQS